LWEELDIDNLTFITYPSAAPVLGATAGTEYSFWFNINDSLTATPNTNTITVSIDGNPITPASIFQKGNIGVDGTGVTTVYCESATPLLSPFITHTNVVSFSGTTFSGTVTRTNYFNVAINPGPLDRVHHYPARFTGNGWGYPGSVPGSWYGAHSALAPASYDTNASGYTGLSGDYAAYISALNTNALGTSANGSQSNCVYTAFPIFFHYLNQACANDTLTISFWIKHTTLTNNIGIADVWLNSPTASQDRGLNCHGPYTSNLPFYFDTGGNVGTQYRISETLNPSTLPAGMNPSLTNATTWLSWVHIVLVKNGGDKQLYINGVLFMDQYAVAGVGNGAAPLYTDMNALYMGGLDSLGDNRPEYSVMGSVDDFAFYSTVLSQADITRLASGTPPNQISAASSLLAWWDFNDVPSLSVSEVATNPVVNFSQVLQYSTNVLGPYVDVPNATSPYTNNVTVNPTMFFRARK
jgi:hypothetical protein